MSQEPPAPTRLILKLRGPVPSKKNNLMPAAKRSGKSGLMYKRNVRAEMDSLLSQIQWHGPPVGPDSLFIFVLDASVPAKDRDGMETTLIDVLKKAGVIHEDSIECMNGWKISAPAAVDLDRGIPITTIIIETDPPPDLLLVLSIYAGVSSQALMDAELAAGIRITPFPDAKTIMVSNPK